MSDIDYHSIYTQFVTEKCKDFRPAAIVVSGVLQKIDEPVKKINLYHILPLKVGSAAIEAIRINCSNPHIQSVKVIKHVDTVLDSSLKCEVLSYKTKNSIMYTDVLKFVDPTTTNIVLYDSVVLEQVWADYLGYITTGTFGVLSAKTLPSPRPEDPLVFNDFGSYAYDIDNINGFVFFGRPSIDLPYYPNVYGSKHMVVKKFYASKFNVVNLAHVLPCFMFEPNPDYSSTDSYMHAPSFSLMIVTPQEQSNTTDLVIDENDIFSEKDETPLDSCITIEDAQVDPIELVPFIDRLGLSIFEKAVRTNFYMKLREEYEHRLAQYDDIFSEKLKGIDGHIESVRVKREIDLDEQLKHKSKELVQKYAAIEAAIVEDLDAKKRKKLQEIESAVTTECELIRAKKMLDIEGQSKTMFDALEAQYSAKVAEHQKMILEYESSEKLRVDDEIANIRIQKLDDVISEMNAKKAELERGIEEMRAQIESKLSTEVRAEFTSKYNDEYLKSLIHMNQKFEERQNSAFRTVDDEAKTYKEKKFKEIEAWERIQRNKALTLLAEYESAQKQKILDSLNVIRDNEIAKITISVKHQTDRELTERRRGIEREIQSLRSQMEKKVNEDATDLMRQVTAKAKADATLIRDEMVQTVQIELTEKKRVMELELAEENRQCLVALHAAADAENAEYIDKLVKEREAVIHEKSETIRKTMQSKIDREVAEAFNAKQAEHIKSVNELDRKYEAAKTNVDSEIKKLQSKIDGEIDDYRKKTIEKCKKDEESIRNQMLESRKIFLETEYLKLKENMLAQLDDEKRTRMLAAQTEEDRIKTELKKQTELHVQSDKVRRENELTEWYNTKKAEISALLDKEYAAKEESLKEVYELKKCNYAETFSREIEELERGRINYHAREQTRLATELAMLKEKALASIDVDVNAARQEIIRKIEADCEDHRKAKIREIEDKVLAEMKTTVEEKTRKLESEIEPAAVENVRQRISEIETHEKAALEEYIESERVSRLKKIHDDLDSIRMSSIAEIQKDIETIKRDMKAGMIDVLHAEIADIRAIKLAEVEAERQRMIRDAEAQIVENERRRKAKVKEMEEMLLKFK